MHSGLSLFDLSQPVKFIEAGLRVSSRNYLHITRELWASHITVVLRGRLYIEIDGERVDAQEGSVMVHRAGAVQRGYAPTTEELQFAWILFTAQSKEVESEHLNDVISDGMEYFTAARAQLGPIPIPRHLRPHDFDLVSTLALELASRARRFPDEANLQLRVLLLQLAKSFLFSQLSDYGDKGKDLAADVSAYIRGCVRNRKIVRGLNASMVAERFSRNGDYLNRLLRKKTGFTISGLIRRERLRLACRLLRTTSLSVKETSAACGYAGSRYFSRDFKRYMGDTPLNYRKRQRII